MKIQTKKRGGGEIFEDDFFFQMEESLVILHYILTNFNDVKNPTLTIILYITVIALFQLEPPCDKYWQKLDSSASATYQLSHDMSYK